MATSKDIRYLDRDFDSLKQGLIEFAKVYYPNTYNDFNEASPGMMFIEMASYVGDVLNYYIDSQLKESLILQSTERNNVMMMAAAMGYKPKISIPSVVDIDVFQLLPASGSGVSSSADLNYALKIEAGMQIRSSIASTEFIIQDAIDFKSDNIYESREISVYSLDEYGAPTYYLAKKTAKAISARIVETTVEIGAPTKFYKTLLTAANIIGIQDITDSDGNTWYEVPYLAQDTVFEQVQNTAFNDPDASVYSAETPYLLKLKRVPRRFISRAVGEDLEIQFGAGISSSPDEELLATPENIGLSLPTGKPDIDFSIDPTSPVYTSTYGLVPSNTTLTIRYLVGGGIQSNVPSSTINEIIGINTANSNLPPNTPTLNTTIINSIVVNNPIGAVGGRSGETIDEIRQNAIAQLSSQNRAVTREDYIIRAYSMPTSQGSVAKVYINPDEQNRIETGQTSTAIANPLAMNMYVLSYNSDKSLVNANRAIKENLKTYISQYRMLTDSINIRDAYIINIGIDFEIITIPSSNSNEVLLKVIQSVKTFFNIDNWQINQPIIISDLFALILSTSGVQTVTNINIINKNQQQSGYSNVTYNIELATKNGIIYPSLDPSIFEVKYPNLDIKGRIATF